MSFDQIVNFRGGPKTLNEIERILYIENSQKTFCEFSPMLDEIIEMQETIDDLESELHDKEDNIGIWMIEDEVDHAVSFFRMRSKEIADSEKDSYTKEEVLDIIKNLKDVTSEIKYSF